MNRILAACVVLSGCGDQPPPPVCDQSPRSHCDQSDRLVSYGTPGTWDAAAERCVYQPTTRECVEGCFAGRCNEDATSTGWISFIELNDARLDDWHWSSGVRARFSESAHWLLSQERTIADWSTHVATDGDCSLYENELVPRLCAPMCGWNEECVVDGSVGECVALPRVLDVGTVSVSSDRGAVELTPDEHGRYRADSTPDDLFGAGATVTATAAGGEVTGFGVTATGVAPLEIASATVGMTPNTSVQITWTVADPGSRIQVLLVSGPHHPSKPLAGILCDLPDGAGTVTLAAPLVTGFLERTYLWNRYSHITRYRTGEVTPHSDPIELFVGSARALHPSRN